MELVNLMYKYINKFINGNDLLNSLKAIDKNKFSEEEKEIIDKLICDIENIVETVPNEIDEIEKKRIEDLDKILCALKKGKENENNSDEAKEYMNNHYQKLLKEKEIVRDGGKLFNDIFDVMTSNSLIVEYAKKMNDEELLDFITQYISVPLPPKITQDEFDDLVKVGIENDKREKLWRLAFNYNHKNIDFSLIEDYFIEKKDDYYIVELICAVKEDLDIKKLIGKILSSNDKTFIEKTINYGNEIRVFDEEELKLLNKES